ncbi:MAG: DUF4279 domain-containing protein [Deltaproteobacteria bacterium]|nr:DUF4279 domain-containing protein [Deltaproteobacteria bacterium]
MATHFPFVTLGIYGTELKPEIVTSKLAMTPSSCHQKGDTSVSQTGKKWIAKTGAWLLYSSDLCDSPKLEDHLKIITNVIPKTDLTKIAGAEEAKIVICVSLSQQPEIVRLSASMLKQLIPYNAVLTIEAYEED